MAPKKQPEKRSTAAETQRRASPKKQTTSKPTPKKVPPAPRYRMQPRKLNLETARIICHYLRCGAWIDTAAAAAQVGPNTVKHWIERGNKALALEEDQIPPEELIYAEFAVAVNEAIARAELIDLKRINAAGKAGNWQATSWKMKCRYGDNWKEKHTIEHTGKDGKPIAHAHAHLVELDIDSLPIEVCEQILDSLNAQRSKELQLPAPKEKDDGEDTN